MMSMRRLVYFNAASKHVMAESALVEDLIDRGLYEKTLVVAMG